MPRFEPQEHHFNIPSIMRNAGSIPEDQLESEALLRDALALWRTVAPELRRRAFGGEDTLERQLRRVGAAVDHAFETVPLYRELYASVGYRSGDIRKLADLERLPIVTKSMLIEAGIEGRRSQGSNFNPDFVASTSGSSGLALPFYYDPGMQAGDTCEFFSQFEVMLGEPLPEQAWLYSVHMNRAWLSSLDGRNPTFVLREIEDARDFASHLARLRPLVVQLLPSYLPMLAAEPTLFTDAGVKLVVLNSETSSRAERRHYAALFGVPILDEYSSCEVCIIASECGHGTYHVNTEGVYLEIIPDGTGDDWGRTIVTDLRNPWMPMIRYDQGDIARWKPDAQSCQCGRKVPGFTELLGRKDDSFSRRDGFRIPSASLLNLLDAAVGDSFAYFKEFRLVEMDIGVVELVYVPSDAARAVEPLMARLFGRLQDAYAGEAIRLEGRRVDEMPQMPGYKRRKVVSMMSRRG